MAPRPELVTQCVCVGACVVVVVLLIAGLSTDSWAKYVDINNHTVSLRAQMYSDDTRARSRRRGTLQVAKGLRSVFHSATEKSGRRFNAQVRVVCACFGHVSGSRTNLVCSHVCWFSRHWSTA